MTDSTLQQLLQYRGDNSAPTLLILDENAGVLPANTCTDAQVLSNRIDICTTARRMGWASTFADFCFAEAAANRQRALYRISKEKRVVEHVLQSAWALLPPHGELICAGYKGEGIKTYAKRAAEAWECAPVLERGDGNLHLYSFTKGRHAAEVLNGTDYHALQPIGARHGRPVFSKPGIFAWDRFDEGSSFLLEFLPAFLAASGPARHALDLGCGNGLLALALLDAGCGQVTATDNNAAAIAACTFNMQRHPRGESGRVIAADCGDTLEPGFDLVVCNPPFHQGFGVEQDLTERFLQATARLLTARGRALFVVNSFIPLERKAAAWFAVAERVADNRRFKLVELRKQPG